MGVLTARFLGPIGRGEFYLAMQIISIGSIILATGIGPAYQFYLTNGQLSKSHILSHLIFQITLIGILILVIGFIFPFFQNIFFDFNFEYIFLVFCLVGILFNVINLFLSSAIQSESNGILIHTILSSISSLINLLLLVIVSFNSKLDFTLTLLIYFIALVFQVLPKFFFVFKSVSLTLRIPWLELTKSFYRFGGASFLTNIAVILVFRIDTFFVNKMRGLEELGIYAMAVSFAEILLMFPSSIGTALFAHLPKLELKEKLILLTKVTRIITLTSFLIFIIMMLISKYLIIYLLGMKYSDAIIPLQIISFGLVGMSTNYVFSNFYSGNGKPLKSSIVFGKGLFINIGLNFLLISYFGIIGAAFASSITYFVIAFLFFRQIKKEFRITLSQLFFPQKSDFVYLYDLLLKSLRLKQSV